MDFTKELIKVLNNGVQKYRLIGIYPNGKKWDVLGHTVDTILEATEIIDQHYEALKSSIKK